MDDAAWKAHLQNMKNPSVRNAFVITGPTSGIGRSMALAVATSDALVFLVARDAAKLDALVAEIAGNGGHAVAVVVDLEDLPAVQAAARTIAAGAAKDDLRLLGLLNNAGMQQRRPTTTAAGLEKTFAVNHLAAFALTDALLPSLAPGAAVVFLGSGTEDPELPGATAFGFRGARFLSVGESARGQFAAGGASIPGLDAYATSKLCNILSARGLAREIAPEAVRFYAFDPGLVPGTGLAHGEVGALQTFAWHYLLPLVARWKKGWSTPERAGRIAAQLLKDASGSIASGTYVDDGGRPQPGSAAARDDALAARVVAETRAFLRKFATAA
jgi:NAD(P)-dependent dehydrogenase (short-subunit alcohol dehydrogenase family)